MPSIAPLVAAFKRRLANLPGPVRASGEVPTGEPVQVEMFLGGAWVDITSYVLTRDGGEKIQLSRGQRDEGSETEQSTAHLQLNNRDGRFSPRLPTGPYFGQLGRNIPFRISVPDGDQKMCRGRVEVSAWPTRWDLSGNDVWVEAEGGGLVRRLVQGAAPTRSLLYNAITSPLVSSATLRAYWPCEDAATATSVASALTSGSRMTVSGTVTMASYDGFGASDPVPDLSNGALSGGVTKYDDPTSIQVRFLINIPSGGLDDGKVLCAVDQVEAAAGLAAFWELRYSTASNSVGLWSFASDGAMLGVDLEHTLDVRGRQLRVSIELQETGGTISRAIRLTDLSSLVTYSVSDSQAASLQRVTRVQLGPATRGVVGPFGTRGLPGCAVGHVMVQDVITSVTDLGVHLNPVGEVAGRRIERLCAAAAIPFTWIGDLDDTVPMGGQSRLRPIELMRECSQADGGVLYEDVVTGGLGYRTRVSLLNQDPALTLSYPDGQLAEVPSPVDDDQLTRNDITVSLPSGGTVGHASLDEGPMSTQDPPAGIGVYGEQVTLNLADDSTLDDQAMWRLHLGTVDEARYPQIAVNLAHPQFTSTPALRSAALSVRQGDRIVITDPPAWLPPDDISLIVIGISETIDHFEHRISYTCRPESPWRAGILDHLVHGPRLDTAGSELAANVDAVATSVSVATTSGPRWTTDSTDMPFDVRVGGEVWTVTAVSGSSSPQTFTVTRSVNGVSKSHSAGADLRLLHPTILAL